MGISFASSLRSYPGDQRTRRQIFQALGVSFVLTAKDLRIKRHPLLEFFGEHREALDALTAAEKTSLLGRAELGEFEPRKTGSWSTKKTSFRRLFRLVGRKLLYTNRSGSPSMPSRPERHLTRPSVWSLQNWSSSRDEPELLDRGEAVQSARIDADGRLTSYIRNRGKNRWYIPS